MERYHKYMGEYPNYPMADAGYRSYDNYMYCLTHGMGLYMKYTSMPKRMKQNLKRKNITH